MADVGTADQPGPTVIRVVAEDAPDVITWGPWLEHVALRGDCVCGEAWIWRTEVDGRHIADWVGKHANCKRARTLELAGMRDRALCATCKRRTADYHGADGWICAGCADENDPPYEG